MAKRAKARKGRSGSKRKNTQRVLVWLYVVVAAVLVFFGVRFALYYHDYVNVKLRDVSARLPKGYALYGIDVSNHQGDVHWDKLRIGVDNGHRTSKQDAECVRYYPVSFAFVKATEGSDFKDKRYKQNVEKARGAGVVVGSYHYFKPNRSAKRQAEHFVRHLSLQSGDLPPVLDVEELGRLSKDALCDSVLVFLQHVELSSGVRPLLYANEHYLSEVLTDRRLRSYRIWLAHYGDRQRPERDFWHFWQFTDVGEVFGIHTAVDINVFTGRSRLFEELLVK